MHLRNEECLYITRKRENLTQKQMAQRLKVPIELYRCAEAGQTQIEITCPKQVTRQEKAVLMRRRLRWSQERLAKQLGKSRTWVNRVEAGLYRGESLFRFWGL